MNYNSAAFVLIIQSAMPPVKSLLRFKCVSNPWNTLISDPNFVKSKSQNPQFKLITQHENGEFDDSIIPYPIPRLLDNPSFTLVADPHSLLNEKDCSRIAALSIEP